MKFQGYRERKIQTFGGCITCPRAYYTCKECSHTCFPLDETLQLKHPSLSPAIEELSSLCGAIADSFDKGSDLLERTTGTRLSESTVQRVTEAVGNRVSEQLLEEKTFGKNQSFDWYTDATGQTVGYVSIDATGIRRQGPNGSKIEGRMAYVGMIYNPIPDLEKIPQKHRKIGPMEARYISGLYGLEEMGPIMRNQGGQVGLDSAEKWVALSDGGNGLEPFLEMNFPRVEAVILDFFHASEYLCDLAKSLYPGDEEKSLQQGREWSSYLKSHGGEAMLEVLQKWDYPNRKSVSEQKARVLGFFENQKHRMNYPEYLKNGWFIGSGAVESACKTVVGQRLKGSGMRWSENGGHGVCNLRALYRSQKGQWDAFWGKCQ
jgi:hypothetical protein